MKKLGEITRSFAGGTPNRAKDKYYRNGTIPWVKSGEVDNRNIIRTEEKITNIALVETSARPINPNSILVALYGATAGKIGILRCKASSNQAVLAIENISSRQELNYLYYQLSISNKKILSFSQGSGQPNLSKQIIDSLQIPLPPLAEQKRIAEILGTVDEKLDSIEDQIAQTQQLKKGVMQKLLTKGIGHTEFKDSPLGPIPISWEVRKLNDFVNEIKGGASLRPTDFVETNGFPVIPKKSITRGGVLKIDKKKPILCTNSFTLNNQNYIVDNSYIITTLRDLVPSGPSIGYMVQYFEDTRYILAQGVYGIKLNKELNKGFIIQYSNSQYYRSIMNSIMVGSTQVHIRNGDFLGIKIPFPPLAEQQQIADILSTIDEKIDILKEKRDRYSELKRGLMQQLLTGKIRTKA
ncbi:restriction endonuclease subunit S [Halosquirtibacter laminarini]|uniref:Restriction endonuclease subunit S n=1 Tax=Halosquirtibacter laminarini TaxID=3374600 RepID=A0AC61NKF3_9BACT|nr:restriction endonuclease subunit S [Prolixibacteraceae bacterium]